MARITLAVVVVVLCGWPGGGPAHAAGTPVGDQLRVDPTEIPIDSFFAGARVHVEGAVPEGSEIAVVVSSDPEPVALKVKGKVWGLLWLNVGDVTFTRVPSLYLLATSAPLDVLGDPDDLIRLGVGYDALASATDLEPDPEAKAELFAELVKMKEHEGLYREAEGSVVSTTGTGGEVRAVTEIGLPSRTPPGRYTVRLLALTDGRWQLVGTRELSVTKTGLVHLISHLAETRSLLYGVLAAGIAIFAGLLTGAVFSLGGKHAH